MIISASRRTDIPACHAQWLSGRISEGFAESVNPFNARQVRRVSLDPADVDGFVFWSKNPAPLLALRDALRPYPLYLQYTVNGYGDALEPGVPPLKTSLDTFRAFVDAFGAGTALWRYDPVVLGGAWDEHDHAERFARIAEGLRGYTSLCTISFYDTYRCTLRAERELGIRPPAEREMRALAASFAQSASAADIRVVTCCETVDLAGLGVTRGACVDAARLSALSGKPVGAKPDKNQRAGCGCSQSVDIGAYGTCGMGCRYCYAKR